MSKALLAFVLLAIPVSSIADQYRGVELREIEKDTDRAGRVVSVLINYQKTSKNDQVRVKLGQLMESAVNGEPSVRSSARARMVFLGYALYRTHRAVDLLSPNDAWHDSLEDKALFYFDRWLLDYGYAPEGIKPENQNQAFENYLFIIYGGEKGDRETAAKLMTSSSLIMSIKNEEKVADFHRYFLGELNKFPPL
jgi:hypothetical protein